MLAKKLAFVFLIFTSKLVEYELIKRFKIMIVLKSKTNKIGQNNTMNVIKYFCFIFIKYTLLLDLTKSLYYYMY